MTELDMTELIKPAPKMDVETPSAGNLSDMGNARRIVTRHGDKIRYVHAMGKWLVWSGSRWEIDETGAIMRLAKETVLAMFFEVPTIMGDVTRDKFIKWAMTSQSRSKLESLISLAKTEKEISAKAEDLDANPWLINLRNCTIDMKTWETSEHDPKQLLTKCLDFDFDMKAKCPTWEKFINRIFDGDSNLIRYVQRAIGLSLTGHTGEQCMFFMFGSGKNGKSTFIETMKRLLREYSATTPSDTLMKKDRSGISNDVARLAGKRLVVASETDEGQHLSEHMLKDLTGSDTITARYLHQEFFEFQPQFKLWMFGNHKPLVRGTDMGIWRRIRLIPFTVTITAEERDPNLQAKLEHELPGIFNWALLGLHDYQANGLGEPVAVSDATEEYRIEMDVLGTFITEMCTVKTGVTVEVRALYLCYSSWCEDYGERPLPQRAFAIRLKERGFIPTRSHGGVRCWSGISVPLKSDT